MQKGKGELLASRPTAVSLWNGVQSVFKDASPDLEAEELRRTIISNADAFIKRSKEAVEIIGRIGSKRIRDGDKVLTHCNSKAALSVIIQAHRDGKDIEVFATESRPWRQGLLTARDLAKAGIRPTLIVDSAARWLMKDVDVVVVGADTICSNGALINKIGTSQIALAAHEARVPFMVCAETFKFSPEDHVRGAGGDRGAGCLGGGQARTRSREGTRVLNPVFDATPAGVHRRHRHRGGGHPALRRLRDHRQGTGA